jgi:hypothetical protein
MMKTPWHIWVVGLITLMWHAFGAYDYTMSELRDAAYLSMMPEDQRAGMLAYLDAMPSWAVATWALGVWGSVLGSVLILARSRHAVNAFVVSLLGFIGTSLYTYLIAPASIMSQGGLGLVISGAIMVILLGTMLYARAQVVAGRLR